MGEGGSAIDLYRLNMYFVAETDEVVFIKNKDKSDHKPFWELSSRLPRKLGIHPSHRKGLIDRFAFENGASR